MDILRHKEQVLNSYIKYTVSVHDLRSVLNDVVGKSVELHGGDDIYIIKSTFVAMQDGRLLIEIEIAPEEQKTTFNKWRKVEDTRVNWNTLAD
jgi:hypothetical protein